MALVAGACSGAPPRTPPLQEPVGTSLRTVALSGASAAEAPPAAEVRFACSFGDPTLNALVDEAWAGSPALVEAAARVRRAVALARVAAGALQPSLDAVSGARVGRQSRPSGSDFDVVDIEAVSLGVEASYEIDLWGRVRAGRDAARYAAAASGEDLAAARLSVAASLAVAWYGAVSAQRLQTLLDEQEGTNGEVLDRVRGRFGQGQAEAADVLRQESLLEALADQRILAEQDRATRLQQVNVLRGRPPLEVLPEQPADFPELGPLPALGNAFDALRDRPDVRAAWHRVHQADRELSAAIADRKPRATVDAGLLLGGGSLADLARSWLAEIGRQFSLPLADGGTREAAVDAACALRMERLAAYGTTLLQAVLEVEDALLAERMAARRQASLERQRDLARRTVEALLDRYGSGETDYLDVLDALQSEQSLARQVLAVRFLLVEARIRLLRALAASAGCGPCPSPQEPPS